MAYLKSKNESIQKTITDIAQPKSEKSQILENSKKKQINSNISMDFKDKNYDNNILINNKKKDKLEHDLHSKSLTPLLNIAKILYDEKTYEVFNLIVKYEEIGDDKIDNKLHFGNTEINKSLTILEGDRLIKKVENKKKDGYNSKVVVNIFEKNPYYINDLDKKLKIFLKNIERKKEEISSVKYYCIKCNETYPVEKLNHLKNKCKDCDIKLTRKEDDAKINFDVINKLIEKINENFERCKQINRNDYYKSDINNPLQRLEFNLSDQETIDNLNFFDKKYEDELRFFSEFFNYFKAFPKS